MGGGSKKETCYTAGYRYFAGLQLVFCHSIDKLLNIRVGEREAWAGEVTENQMIVINKPELFGGEGREGGIRGRVDICFGGPEQDRNSYLQSVLGDDVPAYRGLFGLIGRQVMVSNNNPYIKEWSVMGQRTTTGWLPELEGIVSSDGCTDMNPAHIIRECLTNTTWGGLGYPESDLDADSFEDAAYRLGSGDDPNQEAFGLSLLWAKNSSIEDFIKVILSHISGVLYVSHLTGLLKLKLIRNDYTIALLPELNESNIVDLIEYTSPASTESVNQVVLNYVDRSNQARAITVQDIAGISRQSGQVNQSSINMPGIAVSDLASKVASRELQQLCLPLASCTLVINRVHADLEPGDCFRFSWAALGIKDMVMRVGNVEVGEYTDSTVRITAVRDVYGLGAVAMTVPQQSLWTSPYTEPANAVRIAVHEITWWQFVLEYAGDSEAVLAELDDSSTAVICVCGAPSSDSINYEMWIRNTGSPLWEKADTGSFPATMTTSTPLVPEVESVIALQESLLDTDLVKAGTYALLGDELVAVLAVDELNVTVTVARGVLDTLPVAHPAGTFLWFHQGLYGLDRTDRAAGEIVDIRLLPSTSSGRLDIDDADTSHYTCAGRMMRPYPPGNVRINGERWPDTIGAADELALTWAHRDRTTQTVTLNHQDEGDIGPEAGVTYTLRIYGETDILLRELTGLTATAYTYLTADEQADSGFDPARLNTSLLIELESVRGELVSFNTWNLSVTRV